MPLNNLLYELYKNFRIIFRSMSSVSILILGPLVLILLLGFAFSGQGIHGVTIGVRSDNFGSITPMLANFTQMGDVKEYKEIDDCISDLRLEKSHLCLDFSDSFGTGDEGIPQGQIVFYYDNSRKQISSEIVDKVTAVFGLKSEEISIESAKTIFSNIETMVVFLNNRNSDLDALVNESLSLKQDLEDRKESLISLREEFMPRYLKVKEAQSRIDNLSENMTLQYDSLIREMGLLKSMLSGLDAEDQADYSSFITVRINDTVFFVRNLSLLSSLNITYTIENVTPLPDASIPIFQDDGASIADTGAVDNAISAIDAFENTAENSYKSTMQMKSELDMSIGQLDELKILLDTEIENTGIYIQKIDAGTAKIKQLKEQLDSNLDKLSRLNPSLAEKLIRPILQSFEPILEGVKNIKIAFPALLSQIILFISILFSNIVTQSELNSKAYLRNLIAPVNDLVYTIGLILTNLIVVVFQVAVLLAVAQFSFGIDIFSVLGQLSIVVLLLALIFILLGMSFAFLFDNEQTSILTVTFLSLTFFLFSDSIVPIEIMPPAAGAIASLNPFVLSTGIFKKLILYQVPLGVSAASLSILLIYLSGSAAFLYFISKSKNKKRV